MRLPRRTAWLMLGGDDSCNGKLNSVTFAKIIEFILNYECVEYE
jgi:hypothetical protein